MNRNDERDALGEFQAPRAPADLKRRVLDAAAAALDAPVAPTIWDLLWESRLARAGWVVATLGLIVAHVFISVSEDSPASRELASTRSHLENLRVELDLPSVVIAPRAEALVMGPLPASTNETEPRDDDPKNEEVQG